MLGPAGTEDALDAGHQLTGRRDLGVRGKRLGDIEEIAGGQRRARRDAVGGGIVPPQPQQLRGERRVAASGIERRLAVDRHPGAPIVDDGAVFVEQDAADRHLPPPLSMCRQAAHTAPGCPRA